MFKCKSELTPVSNRKRWGEAVQSSTHAGSTRLPKLHRGDLRRVKV